MLNTNYVLLRNFYIDWCKKIAHSSKYIYGFLVLI